MLFFNRLIGNTINFDDVSIWSVRTPYKHVPVKCEDLGKQSVVLLNLAFISHRP